MRFTAITIENFKNVEHGELSFINKRLLEGPSVLALYGQNGSGKSALVDSLMIFKALMGCNSIPDQYADYIMKGSPCARIQYELETLDPFTPYCRIKYEVEIRANDIDTPIKGVTLKKANNARVRILSETLSLTLPGKSRMREVFSTANTESFRPAAAKKTLIASKSSDMSLSQLRDACYNDGRSCLEMFGESIASLYCEKQSDELEEELFIFDVISELQNFASKGLFIVGSREAEMLENGSMELYANQDFLDKEGNERIHYLSEYDSSANLRAIDPAYIRLRLVKGSLTVSTDAKNPLPLTAFTAKVVTATLDGINALLHVIVPGLYLRLHMNEQPLQSNDAYGYVESCREGRSIPLSCESRGVQKIVSVAWLLISVYNNPRVTAVIDELDSGIFEYLLGEILRVVSEEGQGQLIFTSHNLRPLEVLDKGYIAFTTSNPEKRYIRMKNVKATNNLRDFYYRSILLGGQDESIYEPSTNGEITLAFIKAGADVIRTSGRYDKSLKGDLEYFFGDNNADEDVTPPAILNEEGGYDA